MMKPIHNFANFVMFGMPPLTNVFRVRLNVFKIRKLSPLADSLMTARVFKRWFQCMNIMARIPIPGYCGVIFAKTGIYREFSFSRSTKNSSNRLNSCWLENCHLSSRKTLSYFARDLFSLWIVENHKN